MKMGRLSSIYANILCILLQYAVVLAEWNTKDYMKREHSLIKPYNDGRWDIVGSAIVTNNYVRLTPDHQSRRGGIWSNTPVRLRDWELHVHFKVHGHGTDLFGDGMAVWYVRDRLRVGEVFGSVDPFFGIGIFMDTYSNHNGPHNHGHPYVSAMVNNGSFSYDHDRDGTHTEIAGCEAQFRKAPQETYLAIRYERNKLTVSTDIEGKNAWKQCFSVDGVRLPTGYYFGASAATGELADNHDVISMKLYDIGVERKEDDMLDSNKIEPSADFFSPPRDHVEDPKGSFMSGRITGWRLFIMILLLIIGVGVCGMVGYVIFNKKQQDARKRFY